MLIAVLVLYVVLFLAALWASVTVTELPGLPAWRRWAALALFLVGVGLNLLRLFDLPEMATVLGLAFHGAAVALAAGEIGGARDRKAAAGARW
ncbi:hypothetical protein [Streptomyces lonarensis]|uniref:Uncharacterized protein n=1 Tax=Streptomyces lonarensis TaxID=700599 RepID=A0A7X6CZ33_9ACTN|nr:hypothetical protein [Streptomyces lonarensis]NJQ05095.1 hypothetical protein [Streptomyces lonarensis]